MKCQALSTLLCHSDVFRMTYCLSVQEVCSWALMLPERLDMSCWNVFNKGKQRRVNYPMKPDRDGSSVSVSLSQTHKKRFCHQLMRSRSHDALWSAVRSSLMYAASAGSLALPLQVLREYIRLWMLSHSHGNAQFTANPQISFNQSHCCAVVFSLHHHAFVICSFSDIWRLSAPHRAAGRAINSTHLQPAQLRANMEFRTEWLRLTLW